jgi:DNA repair protein SbcD/Mre11
MSIKFLHCADIHLGYLQYNAKDRFNDFSRALSAIVDKATGKETDFDQAIQGPVDFVILAGDLFQKRAIDALTLNQAMRALQRLRAAHIPCIAVEGNHERSYYEETIGWMKFLALQDLLILLDAEFVEGRPILQAWEMGRRQGSYIDLPGGVRVHGLRYYGSGTVAAVQAYAEALAALPKVEANYTIFVAHAGVEGQMDDKAGGLSPRQWAPLRPHVDYLALGHFHKPFRIDEWIYNPGSPENCSIAEAEWKQRGYLMVNVDMAAPRDEPARHLVAQGNNPRRACRLYLFKTDRASSPDDLMRQLRAFLQRKATELADELATNGGQEFAPAVIELYLSGVLPFERASLDMTAVEMIVKECFTPAPLVTMVKNLTQPAKFEVDVDNNLSRAQLEHSVLAGLFGRDIRYAARSEEWAALAVNLKQLALAEASPAAILDDLAAQVGQIEKGDHADPAR